MSINERIAEGRRLLTTAAIGPWSHHYDAWHGHSIAAAPDLDDAGYVSTVALAVAGDSVEFITWARNNLPALLDSLERVRALAESWSNSGNASYMRPGDDILEALEGP